MTQRGMAEARPDPPKRYTCACGLAQEDRKSKFLGKCRHCHTRAKYLRGQSSFDSGSASRGWTTTTTTTSTTNTTTNSITTTSGSPAGSTGSSPNNSSSSSNNTSDGDGGNSSSSSSRSSSSGATAGGAGGGTAATGGTRIGGGRQGTETRRRSRSMDRYDAFRITDPPPYSWVASGSGSGREGGREVTRGTRAVRRAESEDSGRGAARASQIQTPPPPYEVAQSQSYYQQPPSYEEALANSMSGVRLSSTPQAATPRDTHTPPVSTATSTRSSLLAGVTSPTALLPVGVLTSRNSRVLEEQAAVLEAQREAQLEAQRQAQREAQREAQLERERDMERQRLRELQLAQYCGCAKCQSLYYSYYYDDPMSDGGAFPMETQVLMQEVLTDGLAFCSLM